MLLREDVPRYLLEGGLLGPDSIVSGDLVVQDVSRRNRNHRVIRKRGTSYFVKQGIGSESRSSVAREAAAYRFLESIDSGREFAPYLPRLLRYDPDPCVLVLELARDAEDVREFHARTGRVAPSIGAWLGAALGTLHRITSGPQATSGSLGNHESAPPWILAIGRPGLPYVHRASAASIALVQVIQRFPAFCEHLDRLRADWRPRCLIHGDLKSVNYVISKSRGRGPARDLRIVDWELASHGDPAWDVGSVFGDYLALWLFSAPITGDTPPERFLELTRFPLDRVSPAIAAFWRAYRRDACIDPVDEEEVVMRSVLYAAARLIQTTYEVAQHSARLDGNAVCILQVSWNLLSRPGEAAASLLGLAPGGWTRS